MKRGCLIGSLVVIISLVLAAGALYGVHRRYYGNTYFNRQHWIGLANKGGVDNPRQRMVKDLRRRYLKPGMTRQQVRHLLGKPDYGRLSSDADSYFIGADGIDGISLDVRYDRVGRLVRSEIVGH